MTEYHDSVRITFTAPNQKKTGSRKTNNKIKKLKEAWKGYSPNHPVLLIPGLASSGLRCMESPDPKYKGKRVWVSVRNIGLSKVLPLPKSMKGPLEKPSKRSPNDSPQVDVFDPDSNSDEAPIGEESGTISPPSSTNSLLTVDSTGALLCEMEPPLALKRKWCKHISTLPDGCTDPPGIQVRAIEGLESVAYLDPGPLTNDLTYVFGPLIETLQAIGYTDDNLRAVPYDWRLPPHYLEERDGYFTKLELIIEDMYIINGNKPVMLISHSMGSRVVQYFCELILNTKGKTLGQKWIDTYVHTHIACGASWLGAPKAVRATITGDQFGLDAFLWPEEGITLCRLLGSVPWLLPIGNQFYNMPEFGFVKDPEKGWQSSTYRTIADRCDERLYKRFDEHYQKNNCFLAAVKDGQKHMPDWFLETQSSRDEKLKSEKLKNDSQNSRQGESGESSFDNKKKK
eukprot:TRINITY_DN3950_c1_g1_i1.p1 TRINITY_DN3950_c1_g1~~TRINITY_DN3950_c1_g1_i1.p1  ORF type:complete len:456 (+),score=85.49 TRINITY_DN3950_c1_g1_i1:1-1368(+)